MAADVLYDDSALGKSLRRALDAMEQSGDITELLAKQTMRQMNRSLRERVFSPLPERDTANLSGRVSSFNVCDNLSFFNMPEARFESMGHRTHIPAKFVRLLAVETEKI